MRHLFPSIACASAVCILFVTSRLMAQNAVPTATKSSGAKAVCPSALFKSPPFPSPASVWDSDTSYIPGIKADGAGNSSAYVVADKLDVTKDNLPSLFRTLRRPNNKVTHVVLDPREVNIYLPF